MLLLPKSEAASHYKAVCSWQVNVVYNFSWCMTVPWLSLIVLMGKRLAYAHHEGCLGAVPNMCLFADQETLTQSLLYYPQASPIPHLLTILLMGMYPTIKYHLLLSILFCLVGQLSLPPTKNI